MPQGCVASAEVASQDRIASSTALLYAVGYVCQLSVASRRCRKSTVTEC